MVGRAQEAEEQGQLPEVRQMVGRAQEAEAELRGQLSEVLSLAQIRVLLHGWRVQFQAPLLLQAGVVI